MLVCCRQSCPITQFLGVHGYECAVAPESILYLVLHGFIFMFEDDLQVARGACCNRVGFPGCGSHALGCHRSLP